MADMQCMVNHLINFLYQATKPVELVIVFLYQTTKPVELMIFFLYQTTKPVELMIVDCMTLHCTELVLIAVWWP